MAADIKRIRLEGLVLPEDAGITRSTTVPAAHQGDEFRRLFDAHTLIYDCVWLPREGGYLFTAPALRNFWPLFRTGLRLDGQPVRRLRRQTIGRCDQVLVRGPAGATLTFAGGGLDCSVPVRLDEGTPFAGGKLLVAISRNNDPGWIAEWARFHIRRHGATGVVLFDNMSDAYGPGAIEAALAGVEGLIAARIVEAPFRYGGQMMVDGQKQRLKFLQTAVINIARRDMAARARAVLSVDIDEMVLNPGGQSVFDAAHRGLVRGLMIGGAWVFPEAPEAAPCPPHGNAWRPVPARPCRHKWCASPHGVFSRIGGWNVHSFGGDWLKRWRSDRAHPDFALAHCAGTTTGWKPDSARFSFPDRLTRDPALADMLAAAKP